MFVDIRKLGWNNIGEDRIGERVKSESISIRRNQKIRRDYSTSNNILVVESGENNKKLAKPVSRRRHKSLRYIRERIARVENVRERYIARWILFNYQRSVGGNRRNVVAESAERERTRHLRFRNDIRRVARNDSAVREVIRVTAILDKLSVGLAR